MRGMDEKKPDPSRHPWCRSTSPQGPPKDQPSRTKYLTDTDVTGNQYDEGASHLMATHNMFIYQPDAPSVFGSAEFPQYTGAGNGWHRTVPARRQQSHAQRQYLDQTCPSIWNDEHGNAWRYDPEYLDYVLVKAAPAHYSVAEVYRMQEQERLLAQQQVLEHERLLQQQQQEREAEAVQGHTNIVNGKDEIVPMTPRTMAMIIKQAEANRRSASAEYGEKKPSKLPYNASSKHLDGNEMHSIPYLRLDGSWTNEGRWGNGCTKEHSQDITKWYHQEVANGHEYRTDSGLSMMTNDSHGEPTESIAVVQVPNAELNKPRVQDSTTPKLERGKSPQQPSPENGIFQQHSVPGPIRQAPTRPKPARKSVSFMKEVEFRDSSPPSAQEHTSYADALKATTASDDDKQYEPHIVAPKYHSFFDWNSEINKAGLKKLKFKGRNLADVRVLSERNSGNSRYYHTIDGKEPCSRTMRACLLAPSLPPGIAQVLTAAVDEHSRNDES